MVPKSTDWRLVYEWRNYRLSCLRMNRKKREFTDVLDPFCIDDDWFVMDVVEFRLHPGPSLDASRKQSVAATINRLGLNDLDWCETRRQHVDQYREHRLLHIVEILFPFVAFAASVCSSSPRAAFHAFTNSSGGLLSKRSALEIACCEQPRPDASRCRVKPADSRASRGRYPGGFTCDEGITSHW